MTDVIKLTVGLGKETYPIIIGAQLNLSTWLKPYIAGQQVLLVSNETVYPLYGVLLKNSLSKYVTVDTCILPDGEVYKHWQSVSTIIDTLVNKTHRRNTTLIALGGGVIGDITGFAAAIYQRGVNFLQIPTTLLAQVDASVGGKTAINHPAVKNLIGAFHQPSAVFIDVNVLKTLPKRIFISGIAEVIKIALLCDSAFFYWIEEHAQPLTDEKYHVLIEAIKKSCTLKATIVEEDEKEQGTRRALLNLGHTFAHAVETVCGYDNWLHGEAVGIGIMLAAILSKEKGWLTSLDITRIKLLLEQIGLPTVLPKGVSALALLDAMRLDKKNKQDCIRFVLLKKIGEAVIVDDISFSTIHQFLLEQGAV